MKYCTPRSMSDSIQDVVQFDGCVGQFSFVNKNRFATSLNDFMIISSRISRSSIVAFRITGNSIGFMPQLSNSLWATALQLTLRTFISSKNNTYHRSCSVSFSIFFPLFIDRLTIGWDMPFFAMFDAVYSNLRTAQ